MENNVYFEKTITLPSVDDYDKKAPISFDGVFNDFDRPLTSEGFQISLIDLQSDEYVLFVHPSEKDAEVKQLIEEIGLVFQNIESLANP